MQKNIEWDNIKGKSIGILPITEEINIVLPHSQLQMLF